MRGIPSLHGSDPPLGGRLGLKPRKVAQSNCERARTIENWKPQTCARSIPFVRLLADVARGTEWRWQETYCLPAEPQCRLRRRESVGPLLLRQQARLVFRPPSSRMLLRAAHQP